jgi:trypanothione synthetase/amidase
MFRVQKGCVAYGELVGYAPGNIPVYSNGSDWHFSAERNVVDGAVTGFKYQCVEFARRWLLQRKGLWLPDVAWAAHVFAFKEVFDAATGEKFPCKPVPNGAEFKPEVDSLLIYPSQEDFPPGHIAAIVEGGAGYIRIADQNNHFEKWADGQHYSEQLDVIEENGKFTVKDKTGRIPLGWVTFPGRANRPDDAGAPHVHPSLKEQKHDKYELKRVTFMPKSHGEKEPQWLDTTQPELKKFVETFGMDTNRSRLDESEANYYTMNLELWFACTRAGNQLHALSLEATKRVLESEEMLRRFAIPQKYWERIRRSFHTQPYALTGRFDFVVDAEGKDLKCFEYNADSASTLLECAVIQEKWAQHVGVADKSFSAGRRIESLLVHAWNEAIAGGVVAKGSKVHFLVDNDDEEQYTALFVMKAAKEAGLDTELCVMFDGFEWRGGHVVDKSTGTRVKTVWKTWAWETAIADDEKAEAERPKGWKAHDGDAVRLCDVMLSTVDDDIHVFEPMWKLIPSNKAILPVLWELAPGHPNLLRTEWDLSEELRKTGYAKKPIVGRCGANVTVHGPDGAQLGVTVGKFGEREMVFQELFQLPKRDNYFAILGGWMIGAHYGGTGLREDKGIITNVESPFSAIRIMLPFEPTLVNKDNAHENPHERASPSAKAPPAEGILNLDEKAA